jgi:hypothetical protein
MPPPTSASEKNPVVGTFAGTTTTGHTHGAAISSQPRRNGTAIVAGTQTSGWGLVIDVLADLGRAWNDVATDDGTDADAPRQADECATQRSQEPAP